MSQNGYEHRVQYYETDQMGIVHHSNYIRWFEEARMDWMRNLGIGYREMEERGMISPVLTAAAKYRRMVRFDDVVEIYMTVKKFNGILLELNYEVRDKNNGELCTSGETGQCFLNRAGKPVSLKREAKDIYDIICKASGDLHKNRDN